MKVYEKKQAIILRKQGLAIGEIASKLNVSKSSVSYWVRDIRLTKEQRLKLNANGHSVEAIEKRRLARLANTQIRRNAVAKAATEEAFLLTTVPLWCVGVSLYWGEGGKTQNTVRIANSDPDVIVTMMRFFREVCLVSEKKFHGHVHTFAHCNVNKAENYWSRISGISRDKFFKTYKKQSSSSKNKRNTLPYGTFQIYVHDSDFFFRMMAWIEYLKQNKI